MREIKLTQGRVALVDDADFEMLSQWRWAFGSVGYACRSYMRDWQTYNVLMHRLLMGAPELQVDHIDGNRLNNQRSNLRVVTCGVNRQNTPARSPTGYKGVLFTKGAYRAQIGHQKKVHYLGRFKDPIDAARAYDVAALNLYGPQAYINGV